MWTRRQALRIGALGLAQAALLPAPVRAATGPTRLVVLIVDGGWDATYGIDPKLGSSYVSSPTAVIGVEEVRTYASIPVAVNDVARPSVSAFFERHAARCAVVNGLWLGGIAHRPNKVRLLTGTRHEYAPDLVTAVAAELGAHTPLGAVDLSGVGFAGVFGADQVRFGERGQLGSLVDPAYARPPIGAPGMAYDPAADQAVAAYLRARAGDPGYLAAVDRAAELRGRGAELAAILAPPEGKATVDLALNQAMDLLDGGFAVSALLETGYDWDTHTENYRQGRFHEDLFAALRLFLDRLESTGAIEDTLVAVISEIGRTPWLNAELGKDHWPSASALLFGGPVAGGRALGGTDDHLDPQPIDLRTGELDPAGELLRYDHFVAGLLEAVGVDPARLLPSVAPFRGFTTH